MTTGFNFIGKMSKEELIEELLAHQREKMEGIEDIDILKGYVVQIRLERYQKTLIEEAGMQPRPRGILGWMTDETPD